MSDRRGRGAARRWAPYWAIAILSALLLLVISTLVAACFVPVELPFGDHVLWVSSYAEPQDVDTPQGFTYIRDTPTGQRSCMLRAGDRFLEVMWAPTEDPREKG